MRGKDWRGGWDATRRNSAFDQAGNVAIALAAAAVGYFFSQRAVFLLAPVFAVLSAVAVLSIPAAAIDNDSARDWDRPPAQPPTPPSPPITPSCSKPDRWSSLAGLRPLGAVR
ncbi:hypothetical protein [uncultured Rhodoblastus sp.]|uniref:hypothetical protein n=1 Tax=uncultured Rhodoblastus sp. TaxID=543037 RepID=UPI0025F76BEF|nr:hypothetical protein [uncultured Rhodoblastus sp.]